MTKTHSNYYTLKNINIKPNSGLDFVLSQQRPSTKISVQPPTSILVGVKKLMTSGYIRI